MIFHHSVTVLLSLALTGSVVLCVPPSWAHSRDRVRKLLFVWIVSSVVLAGLTVALSGA